RRGQRLRLAMSGLPAPGADRSLRHRFLQPGAVLQRWRLMVLLLALPRRSVVVAMTAAFVMGCGSPPRGEPVGTEQSGIVNGQGDDADVSVVALARGGHVVCSATLIADDMALTAAHCVVPDSPDAVLVGAVPSSATSIAVRRTS